jgi:adenosylcobinamide-GDP ribazoletransferase
MAAEPSKLAHESRRARLRRDLGGLGRDCVAAVAFLTRLPFPGRAIDRSAVARGALFFPVIGLGLGALAGAVARLGSSLGDQRLAALLAAGLLLAVESPAQLSAVGRCLRTRFRMRREGGSSREVEHPAAFGASTRAATLALATLEALAVLAIPAGARSVALMLALLLSRWAFVVHVYGSIPAAGSGDAESLTAGVKFREFGTASVTAMGLTLALADATGLVLLLAVATLSVALRVLAHHWFGGVNPETAFAAADVTETGTLLLCAALARLPGAT